MAGGARRESLNACSLSVIVCNGQKLIMGISWKNGNNTKSFPFLIIQSTRTREHSQPASTAHPPGSFITKTNSSIKQAVLFLFSFLAYGPSLKILVQLKMSHFTSMIQFYGF